MANGDLNWIANFIWGIADDILRDVYVRGKYRDVILPMTVIRRLDAVLEPTKQAVIKMKESLDKRKIANQDVALRSAAGQAFYNTSPFTLHDLKARAKQQQLKFDFETYLDGFSPNVQEILEKFKFRNQIVTMVEADILGYMIEKFLENSINRIAKKLDLKSEKIGKRQKQKKVLDLDLESDEEDREKKLIREGDRKEEEGKEGEGKDEEEEGESDEESNK